MTESKPRANSATGDPEGDGCVEDARAIQVHTDPASARNLEQRIDSVPTEGNAARHVVGVLDHHDRGLGAVRQRQRGSWLPTPRAFPARRRKPPCEVPDPTTRPSPPFRSRRRAPARRRPPRCPAARAGEARSGCPSCRWARRALPGIASSAAASALEPEDRRILAVDVVPDLGLGHRAAHRRVGTRDGVATQVDPIARCQRCLPP